MTEKLQSILEAEGLSALLGKFNEQGVTDSILGELTDSDLKDLGIDKLGERKRLLAAFGKSGDGVDAVSVAGEPSTQGSSNSSSKAATPAEATKESPWVNTLGMPFVPIPRFETRFCVWPVRVQDYETYCMASGAKFPEIPFPQESDHPIVGVTWNDAIEFCVWLTGKERAEGKIDDKTIYRLPTDLEWSAAVGLPHEPEPTPAERHLKAPGYPWGLRWPPPENAGNYEDSRLDQLGLKASAEHMRVCYEEDGALWQGDHCLKGFSATQLLNRYMSVYEKWLRSWTPVDKFKYTSSIEAFGSNNLGAFDLGGNTWEWCWDFCDVSQSTKVLRGGSYSVSPRADCNSDSNELVSTDNWDSFVTCRSSYRLAWEPSRSVVTEILVKHTPGDSFSAIKENHPVSGFRLVVTSVR